MTTKVLTRVSDYFKLQETKISQPACYTYLKASIFGLTFNVFVTFYGHGVSCSEKTVDLFVRIVHGCHSL